MESCAVYFLVRADRIPKDRRKTTLDEFLQAIYYAGVTENEQVDFSRKEFEINLKF